MCACSHSEVTAATQAIARTEKALDVDRAHLRQVAIEAYVTGGASQALSVVFNGSQQTAGMQQAYIQAASGNLDESETTVLINQRSLTLERGTLLSTEQRSEGQRGRHLERPRPEDRDTHAAEPGAVPGQGTTCGCCGES